MPRYNVQRYTRTADSVDYADPYCVVDPSQIEFRDSDLISDFRAGAVDAEIERLAVGAKLVIPLGERTENRGLRVIRIA